MPEVSWLNFCQSMRNQLNCGSCTAFGSFGAWETNLAMLGIIWDGSEKDLFFCSGGTCNRGNTMIPVLDRAIRGVASEECCPYIDRDCKCGDQRCDAWWLTAKKLKSYFRLNNAEEMKEALNKGAIIGTMAVHQSFMSYLSGVYHSLPYDPIVGYHCIAIVGYSDEKRAWLIRNSWGTGWGMEGYCWLAYGDSEIEVESYEIELSDEAVEPDPDDGESWWDMFIEFLRWLWELFQRSCEFYHYQPQSLYID